MPEAITAVSWFAPLSIVMVSPALKPIALATSDRLGRADEDYPKAGILSPWQAEQLELIRQAVRAGGRSVHGR
jgi:hypothetical protein